MFHRNVVRCLVAVLLVALAACSRTPDEQVLRETVTAMQGALESRDPKAFMAGIADDFTGAQGSVDREELHRILRAQVLANASIGVTTGPLDIVVQGDRATVSFTATFTGGGGRFLPERGSVYTITSGWRRSGDDWVCVNAQWERKL
ncbi:YybH family protein [Dokdonella sp. MW10]|uniref:YybH family protein n=1 Tax=Dokdonella sp. MW10 TaxID=2992926 RepID=UPI003F81CA0B